MMMNSIHPDGQARLNIERLRAVRERIKQQQSGNMGATPSIAVNGSTSVPAGFQHQLSHVQTDPVFQQAPPTNRHVSFENEQASQVEEVRHRALTSVRHDAHARHVMAVRSATASNSLQAPPAGSPSRELEPQGRFGLPLNDIQQVAEKSGFIGMSTDAIERAYATRKSLFVDIKV